MLNAQETVAEIVTKHPACAPIFQRHRIDFCCRGNVAVEAACRDRGLDPSAVLVELERAIIERERGSDLDAQSMSTSALLAHIVGTHHEYLRKSLPFIRRLATKVRRAHGEHNPRLAELDSALRELADTLIPHLDMEENDLFPALVRQPLDPRIATELASMHEDHLVVGAQLGRIREVSGDFELPEWACNSYRTLFSELEHLERDVFRHVHLENNVLMPRFAGI